MLMQKYKMLIWETGWKDLNWESLRKHKFHVIFNYFFHCLWHVKTSNTSKTMKFWYGNKLIFVGKFSSLPWTLFIKYKVFQLVLHEFFFLIKKKIADCCRKTFSSVGTLLNYTTTLTEAFFWSVLPFSSVYYNL